MPGATASMPGALVASVDFTQAGAQRFRGLDAANAKAPAAAQPRALNLLKHRAPAITLRVDSPPGVGQRCPVLNVQLQGSAATYRDYYVDLDFQGERTIVIPEPNTQRMLPEFRPSHNNYEFKMAMYGFDYAHIERLNLRWMRLPQGQTVRCAIVRVEALAEIDTPLDKPLVSIGGASVSIPARLNVGDYAEYEPGAPLRIFDRNGVLLQTLQPPAQSPRISAGRNTIDVKSASPASAKLTIMTMGEPLKW
jgi:hypothetical protein